MQVANYWRMHVSISNPILDMTYLSAREIVHKLPSLLDGSVDVLVEEDEEESGQDVDHHHHLDHVDDGVGG